MLHPSKRLLLSVGISCLSAFIVCMEVRAEEHRVEVLAEAVAADEVSADIAGKCAESGIKVVRGSNRTVCEIWPCKEWPLLADFQPTPTRLYPFAPGQLIGVIHLPRRGNDFRDQQIASGWYTLRFALQPVDGNHVGTSPTQDFLVMIRAAEDTDPANMDAESLIAKSAEAAGSSHPAMLCLQPPGEGAANEPTLDHNEEKDWWQLRFGGKGKTSDKQSDVIIKVVVAGHAPE
ncbi:MAG: hypothetical protein R3E01_00655 [Pirellulaceae bacterium]|nr:hypothetical protein [Planctomycetales bacterium]